MTTSMLVRVVVFVSLMTGLCVCAGDVCFACDWPMGAECSYPEAGNFILNTRHWEDGGCEDNKGDFEDCVENINDDTWYSYTTVLNNEPEADLERLYAMSDDYRGLHLFAHGSTLGDIELDVFADDDVLDAVSDYYETMYGFVPNVQFVAQEAFGGRPASVVLTRQGIIDIFQNGHCPNGTLLAGWYCYAADNWEDTWGGGEIVSFVGLKGGGPVHCDMILMPYKHLGCLDVDGYGYGADGSLWSVYWEYTNGDSALAYAGKLEVDGDCTNKYNCDESCVEIAVGRSSTNISKLYMSNGVLGWEAIKEDNTLGYRVRGSSKLEADERYLVLDNIEAKGSGATYRVPVSSEYKWLHLEEKEGDDRVYRWNDVSSTLTDPVDERIKYRNKKIIGKSGMKALSNKSTALSTNESIMLVYPCVLGEWKYEGTPLIRLYGQGLVDHGGFDEQNIEYRWYNCYEHFDDSSNVANAIIQSSHDYVIIFGNASEKNARQLDQLGMPLPWLYSQDYAAFWGNYHALSLADWEVHDNDGAINRMIGFITMSDSIDFWAYYDKMIDYYCDGPEDYSHRLGTWANDVSTIDPYGRVSGWLERVSMETIENEVHPSWERSSVRGDGNTALSDSVRKSLLDGCANILMLATKSHENDICHLIDHENYDLFDELQGTGVLTHFVPMSCDANHVDKFDEEVIPTVEELLTIHGGGALTSIGPTRGWKNGYYAAYINEYMKQLDMASGMKRVGRLHNEVREELYRNHETEHMGMFNRINILVGDPTLPVYGLFWDPIVQVDDSEEPEQGGRGSMKLGKAMPNPLGTNTLISFKVVQREDVEISIYNVRGRIIRTLQRGVKAPGEYAIEWDGREENGKDVASGIYFCRYQSGTDVLTMKLVVVR